MKIINCFLVVILIFSLTGCGHIHKFSKATCKEPAKCTCGEVKGNTIEHSIENGLCKFCNEAVPISPNEIPLNKKYECFMLDDNKELIVYAYIDFESKQFGCSQVMEMNDFNKNNSYVVEYNGSRYVTGGTETSGQFKLKEQFGKIEVSSLSDTIILQPLSDGTLKLITSNGFVPTVYETITVYGNTVKIPKEYIFK